MGYLGSIPGMGRSPGEEKGYPHQYSGLEISMYSSPWGLKESDITDFHFKNLWFCIDHEEIIFFPILKCMCRMFDFLFNIILS